MNIKELYKNFKNIGITDTLVKQEKKRIRLLNIFCFNWLIIEVVFFVKDAILIDGPIAQLLTHLSLFIGIGIIVFLQYRKLHKQAIALFYFLLFYGVFMFCNVTERGIYVEYFYILIPVFLLLFINNKYILYATFLISYLLFIIPTNFLSIYPEGTFGTPLLILLQFFAFFFIVQHFKRENLLNEALLESKRKELENLNDFQSQFFINVSHEVRTPLTLMKGELDNLEEGAKNSTILYVKNAVNKQINKVKKIVDDVLDLARMKDTNFTLNKKESSLNDLIYKIFTSFQPLAIQKEIMMNFSMHKNIFFVNIDKLFLERAINNIIINAIKYTPKKGSIFIALYQEKKSVILSVKDSGIGIPKDDINLISNRFYQVNNSINKAGGSGIGLAFSKEIIQFHDGLLRIESKLNEGSVFSIKLPLLKHIPKAKKSSIDIFQEKEDNFFTDTTQKNILVVDDNFEMRMYLKSILKEYNCLEAENGIEALNMLSKHTIDFILTDNMMPILNGIDFIKRVKEIQIDTPILMLTAKTDRESKLEVLRLGIDDFMSKPFEKEELLIRIKNALHNHQKRSDFLKKTNISEKEVVKSEWITKVEKYVLNNCNNIKLNNDDIAEYFLMSRSTLNRKIKSETGLTPKELITEVKLQKAYKLINSNTFTSLKSVSLEVGYLHTSHFSKIYKERFGKVPFSDV
ncbi:response regulator [uncultured Polaribacter sp.]|uniref:hybrid sensor histidine kinase/response regulator transcription factor n=1 Tax=uncultured Polaribacter sp. TaxID=174711 RepID=UPI002629035E|nr:response regulator [uncultured Polaribacter sp.]